MSDSIAYFTEHFGRRIKAVVEDAEKIPAPPQAKENKAAILASYSSPVEIIDAWTQDGDLWKCRARRLFRYNGSYQPINDGVEFDLYHPTASEPPSHQVGDRVFAVFRGVWELVSATGGGGGGVETEERTVPILYPARQWASKMPIDGEENKKLWNPAVSSLNIFGEWFINACGLTNEGTQPLPVMELVNINQEDSEEPVQIVVQPKKDGNNQPLYYQNVKLEVIEKFAQPALSDSQLITQWRLLFTGNNVAVPPLTHDGKKTTGFVSAYIWLSNIAALAGGTTVLTKVDYSDQWATTTDPQQALKRGHQVIAPHNVVGYSLAHECSFQKRQSIRSRTVMNGTPIDLSTSVIIPDVKEVFTNKQIFAEVELDLYEITEGNVTTVNDRQETEVVTRKLETITDLLEVEDECIYAFIPVYQNDKPLVKDTVSIENNCTGKPLLGLWKDGDIPQLCYCESIPYGYCIPLKKIETLIKTTCDDCSPVFNPRKYEVGLASFDEFECNKIMIPLHVDYKPSVRCRTT